MIFCVEDDNSIRDLMLYTLKVSGFEARGFENADSFWQAMREQTPELILLDVMLPGEDGMETLRKLKASPLTEDIPVIMATAKDTEYDKILGLDTGADDYLAKPFGMMEMVSRIRAVLRRVARPEAEQVLRCAALSIDLPKHLVTVHGVRVSLTLKEYDLLKLLMEHRGRVFDRETLLRKIWGTDYVGESRTVDVHIGTLRTKLRDAGEMIRTVRGVGYKLEKSV